MTTTAVDVVTGEIMPMAPALPHRDTFGIVADAIALADVICDTELVPPPMRGRADAVVAVVLTGHELGLGPMQSLQTIDIINGRPELSAEGKRALVLARGHGFDIDSHDEYCQVFCRRREWPAEREWRAFTFTKADAERAGLWAKDNWQKYPADMLTARATGRACRALFADVIAGLSYDADELDDLPPVPPVGITGKSPAPAAELCAIDGAAELIDAIMAEPEAVRFGFRDWRKSMGYPPEPTTPEMLGAMREELAKLKAEYERDQLPYEAPTGSPID